MNIIQIVSDTFRRDFLGCYGNHWIHTEHLDAFAEKSLVFDRAYIASFPTIPHRHDLFTGRYTFTYSKWVPLPKEEVVLSQLLRQAGYTTMLIADTHHLIKDGHNFDRGFDGWWWIRGQEADRYMTNPTKHPERVKALGRQYLQNTSLRQFEEDYFVAQTMTAAAKWLELNYDQHEKFFLHVDTFDPHEPWDPPKWYTGMYDPGWKGGDVLGAAYHVPGGFERGLSAPLTKDELNHLRALYAGEVSLVDRWVGKLLQKIEDLGLFENTAIIFTSDHGTYHGEHGYLRKNNHLYEEIVHIPLIIKMPDRLEGRHGRCEALVQPTDLMPTVLDLADVQCPPTVQGKSLLPSIRGEEFEERDMAVSSASLIDPKVVFSILSALRVTATTKDWSLITVRRDAPSVDDLGTRLEPELYHLPSDPKQTRNLYTEKEEIAQELQTKMIMFLESIGTKEEILHHWRSLNKV